MEQIQVFQISPEEFQSLITRGIKEEIEKINAKLIPIREVELLTRNQTKELLKIDLSTLHNWTKEGRLKSYGIAGRVYYKRNEIEECLIPLKK